MPATEKTWRDQKTMHVIFGLTGLIMLFSTVWMFAADHRREWKQYQRKMRSIDVRFTEWRMSAEKTREKIEQRERLEAELEEATAAIPAQSLVDQFVALAEDEKAANRISELYKKLKPSEAEGGEELDTGQRQERRSQLIDAMTDVLQQAKFEEETLLRERKFSAADYDERRANYDLAVRDNKTELFEELQQIVDEARQKRDDLTIQYQTASTRRAALQQVFEQINTDVTRIQKQLDDSQAEYDRLAASLDDRQATYFISQPPFLGKRILEAPIIDAFNSPLKIDNLWTENLTIENGSFGTVRRFDRCTTCHGAIDRTAPGSAVDPLYSHATDIVLRLPLPESPPQPEATADGNEESPTLLSVYGFKLAGEGLVNPDDVTIERVTPGSLAASVRRVSDDGEIVDGLKIGDVIRYVNQDKVLSPSDVERALLDVADWGQPVELTVQRGLPHPYSSHPRLDLFVGSLSPHPIATFGCTICHEGQGSATAFKWASHSPNDDEQMKAWARERGWFNNHHWIYPMYPKRFAESTCLKCHHDVVELGLTDRFSEPPAPNLAHGHNLVREYGCFGCHEINGYEGDQRVGPDMRLEPNYFASAAQIKNDPKFSDLNGEQQSWVNQLIYHPERTEVRHQLLQFLKDDEFSEEPKLSMESHKQIGILSDVENSGNLRKVGPSLRHLAGKVGEQWLYEWIKNPTNFRPSTRMPRFFGHVKHLDEGELKTSQEYEPVEILGLVTYLLNRSQPQEFVTPAKDLTPSSQEEQVARGKVMFETRGCLACHQHDEFPYATATQGPNLSNIGDKFALADTPDPQRWMYTWLQNPNLYHARTKMPNLYLEVIEHPDGTKTDPAADIAAFLLGSRQGWQPPEATADLLTIGEGDERQAHLDGLLMEYLKTKMSTKDAAKTIEDSRVPERVAVNLTGPEQDLLGELTNEKKLLYIGNKTIVKYGCHACHDVPGFEAAKPIGTALADWGRKDPTKLAFEHIAEYLHHGHGHHAGSGADHEAEATQDDAGEVSTDHDMHADPSHGEETHAPDADDEGYESFYRTRLMEHDRAGFIWQKLKEPRSYDYRKARNKDSYNDRLRMPLFPFDNRDREAVITFVLGLVADPPAHEFVYHPDQDREALMAGHSVLEKYNCVGCHIIDPERWTIEFESGMFDGQGVNPAESFPFMLPNFTSDEIEASMKPHPVRGTLQATIEGMPTVDRDGLAVIYDEEGDPIEEEYEYDPLSLLYSFNLWKPTLLEGNPYQVGLNPLEIPATMIVSKAPAYGGDLTRWLIPRVTELEREVEPAADGKQAYGWLPPPLLREGDKVQSDWLHAFLLNPYTIRPATVMRMPKFNLSPAEATDLTRFFAAKDGTDYPYEYTQWSESERLEQANEQYMANHPGGSGSDQPTRLSEAMNIITSNDYCVKCHLVADYDPGGSIRAKAPDLSTVFRRLRPDYLRRWVARPPQILPYTPMPINIQYNADAPNLGGVSQDLYHGTSIEQLDAVVDLLMNYPRYANQRAKVADLVKPVQVEASAESPAAGD